MNLITNASEAIGDRDGLIRVTTGRVMIGGGPVGVSAGLAEGQCLQLEVSDTGRGMSPEVQAKIFDPFFTTKAAGSHGRGLVVVKRIVQSLNGTIQVVSAAGKGSTFRILLPAESDAVRPSRGAVLAPKAEAFEFREATILIVDDEDPLRQAVSKMLRKQGLSVIEATDGSGALDVIRTENVHLDLLLLDVTLPGASSREIYEEAKYLRPGLPVIVASAKTEEMAAAALATRMNRFLRKPYRLVELLSAIRDVLPAEPRQDLVTGCLKRG